MKVNIIRNIFDLIIATFGLLYHSIGSSALNPTHRRTNHYTLPIFFLTKKIEVVINIKQSLIK